MKFISHLNRDYGELFVIRGVDKIVKCFDFVNNAFYYAFFTYVHEINCLRAYEHNSTAIFAAVDTVGIRGGVALHTCRSRFYAR
jgi:hypothetical protein